jgi:hypothetical protein
MTSPPAISRQVKSCARNWSMLSSRWVSLYPSHQPYPDAKGVSIRWGQSRVWTNAVGDTTVP